MNLCTNYIYMLENRLTNTTQVSIIVIILIISLVINSRADMIGTLQKQPKYKLVSVLIVRVQKSENGIIVNSSTN